MQNTGRGAHSSDWANKCTHGPMPLLVLKWKGRHSFESISCVPSWHIAIFNDVTHDERLSSNLARSYSRSGFEIDPELQNCRPHLRIQKDGQDCFVVLDIWTQLQFMGELAESCRRHGWRVLQGDPFEGQGLSFLWFPFITWNKSGFFSSIHVLSLNKKVTLSALCNLTRDLIKYIESLSQCRSNAKFLPFLMWDIKICLIASH